MKLYVIILCAAILTVTSSCTMMKNNSSQVTEGISGHVTYAEGNQMPGPGKKEKGAKPVQRYVYVYEVATAAEAEGQAPLFKSIHTQRIAKVKSDDAGFYQISLKPGKYSVFTQEEELQFFSGQSNEKGELSPVEVLEKQVATYDILINFKAVY